MVAVFALIQLALYPRAIGILDEGTYLAMAYVFRAGTVYSDVAQVPVAFKIFVPGHIAPHYPPAQSLLLVPLTLIDWHLVFALNIVLMVAGFLFFRALLGRLGISKQWGLLYLFFPSLVLYSRTIMTEIPSALLIVAALFFYMRGGRSRLAAGAILGLSLWFRYGNLLPCGLLLLAAGARDVAALLPSLRRHSRLPPWRELHLAPLLVGFLPILVALVAYNLAVYGRIAPSGYSNPTIPLFTLTDAPVHLAVYIAIFLVMYPLMAITPLFYKGPLRLEIWAMLGGSLLVLSTFYWDVTSGGSLAKSIFAIGPRLMLPVIPCFLIAYASALDGLTRRVPALAWMSLPAVCVLGIATTLVVSYAHQQRLNQIAEVRDRVYREIPPNAFLVINGEATKFFNPAWGNRQYATVPEDHPGHSDPVLSQLPRPVAVVYIQAQELGTPYIDRFPDMAQQLAARKVIDNGGNWRVLVWVSP